MADNEDVFQRELQARPFVALPATWDGTDHHGLQPCMVAKHVFSKTQLCIVLTDLRQVLAACLIFIKENSNPALSIAHCTADLCADSSRVH